MADIGKAPSVELTDALRTGFQDAMERVTSLNLNPCATLVDKISNDEWAFWDASKEAALVVDTDGLNNDDLEHEFDLAA